MMEPSTTTKRQPRPLHWKMLIGFVIGLAVGLLAYSTKAKAPAI